LAFDAAGVSAMMHPAGNAAASVKASERVHELGAAADSGLLPMREA
jgi:hypothetical protein